MKKIILVTGLVLGFNLHAADCPTAALQGLGGTFSGVLSPVDFQGNRQPLNNVTEIHTVPECSSSFDFDVHYFNPQNGAEVREVKFSGEWDKAQEKFVLSGEIVNGTLRVIRQGQFVLYFETNFAGNPAHCDEMITLTADTNQIIRSVHCFKGDVNGESLGVRTALATRVPQK